ncbi:DUF6877 family protein [Lactiplantibacillus mudanjiangensis]|nr:DUF6877 family protein [Lactiplantibacillus mudanjiangensis]
MAKKLLPVQIIEILATLLPYELLSNVNQRMMDWKASGGKDDDGYMYQQARVAENYYRFILKTDPVEIEEKSAPQEPIINNGFAHFLAAEKYMRKGQMYRNADVGNWGKGQ